MGIYAFNSCEKDGRYLRSFFDLNVHHPAVYIAPGRLSATPVAPAFSFRSQHKFRAQNKHCKAARVMIDQQLERAEVVFKALRIRPKAKTHSKHSMCPLLHEKVFSSISCFEILHSAQKRA